MARPLLSSLPLAALCASWTLCASCGPGDPPGPTTPPAEVAAEPVAVADDSAARDRRPDGGPTVAAAEPAVTLAPLPTAAPGVAVGGTFACATLGDGAVSCWGDNRFGQLGDPSVEAHVRSFRRRAAPVEGLSGVASVAAGSFHACALGTDGLVSCWGHGAFGQLGDGAHEDRPSPVRVAGLEGVTSVGLGEGHGCALRRDGQVLCWGKNEHGQLGDGTFEGRASPAPVVGLEGVVELAVGRAHACARRGEEASEETSVDTREGADGDAGAGPEGDAGAGAAEGAVVCWGENLDAQLGDGSRGEPSGHRATPAVVPELGAVTSLAAGYGHTCATRQGGEVLCWGRNDSRQLGDGRGGTALDARLAPSAMRGANDVTTIAAGARHTCVARSDGTVACVGLNARGQLGDGSRRLRRTLTAVPGLRDVTSIAAGVTSSCAIARGRVVCWGDNRKGQLGDGQTDPHRATPGAVQGLGRSSAAASERADAGAPDASADAEP